jgi:hypothetical protein
MDVTHRPEIPMSAHRRKSLGRAGVALPRARGPFGHDRAGRHYSNVVEPPRREHRRYTRIQAVLISIAALLAHNKA